MIARAINNTQFNMMFFTLMGNYITCPFWGTNYQDPALHRMAADITRRANETVGLINGNIEEAGRKVADIQSRMYQLAVQAKKRPTLLQQRTMRALRSDMATVMRGLDMELLKRRDMLAHKDHVSRAMLTMQTADLMASINRFYTKAGINKRFLAQQIKLGDKVQSALETVREAGSQHVIQTVEDLSDDAAHDSEMQSHLEQIQDMDASGMEDSSAEVDDGLMAMFDPAFYTNELSDSATESASTSVVGVANESKREASVLGTFEFPEVPRTDLNGGGRGPGNGSASALLVPQPPEHQARVRNLVSPSDVVELVNGTQ